MMSRQTRQHLAWFLAVLTAASGCAPIQPLYLHEDGDLSHYLDHATDIEYPDVHTASLAEVTHAGPPLTISDPEFKEFWDLTLEECVSIALQNSKVIRAFGPPIFRISQSGQGGFTIERSPPDASPGAPTLSDVAIVESKPGLFFNNISESPGQAAGVREGVEAALAQFDAQFSTSLFWQTQMRPQNFVPNGIFTPVTEQTDATFQAEIQKQTAGGTQFFARHNVIHSDGNSVLRGDPGLRFLPTTWEANFELEVRQPLLRGRGAQVNRIPIVLARVGTDIELLQLKDSVENMLCNLELQYWDLHCAYRLLETAKVARDSALVTWRIVYEKWKQGVEPVQAEAQAREQYFRARALVEQTLTVLYGHQMNLRVMIGLSTADGRLIRPIDEPTTAEVEFDWGNVHVEALNRRHPIIAQKWRIKKRQLELVAAKNRLLPQLDATVLYRWLGLGDELAAVNDNGIRFPNVGSRAFEELVTGNFQELRAGLEFTMPVGYRRELAGVRHFQLLLAREKAILEDTELEVSRLLSGALQAVDEKRHIMQSHFNRWNASQLEVQSVEALYIGGKATLDLVLRAQERRAQAQTDYYTAVCDYNKAISLVHLYKGSTMDYCHVMFEEGPWPKKAYWDALGHARRRDASYYFNYGFTRPKVISQGPVPDHIEEVIEPHGLPHGVPAEPVPGEPFMPYEEVPTPEALPDMRIRDSEDTASLPLAGPPGESYSVAPAVHVADTPDE